MTTETQSKHGDPANGKFFNNGEYAKAIRTGGTFPPEAGRPSLPNTDGARTDTPLAQAPFRLVLGGWYFRGRLSCHVSTKYRCHCPCHLQMSLGSGGGRARSHGVAQRPTGDRLTGAWNRIRCFTERASARSAP